MQAMNTKALMELADVKSSEEGYKSNRSSQILKSENLVEAFMSVMTEEDINPLDESLEKIVFTILALECKLEWIHIFLCHVNQWRSAINEFVKNRMTSPDVPIHDPIKRNRLSFFKSKAKSKAWLKLIEKFLQHCLHIQRRLVEQ